MRDEKHLAEFKDAKPVEDLPGLGKHYCKECAKFFESDTNFVAHQKGKVHKRRVKALREEPYSQKEAEAAIGLTTNNGKRATTLMEVDEVAAAT